MRSTSLTTQTTFPFDPPACDEPLTGDRTRIVRITVATQQAQSGRWCVVGGHVVMRLATIGDRDTAATILPVGMPVFARRGSRWTRWRGAPALWPYDRVLVDQIARVA